MPNYNSVLATCQLYYCSCSQRGITCTNANRARPLDADLLLLSQNCIGTSNTISQNFFFWWKQGRPIHAQMCRPSSADEMPVLRRSHQRSRLPYSKHIPFCPLLMWSVVCGLSVFFSFHARSRTQEIFRFPTSDQHDIGSTRRSTLYRLIPGHDIRYVVALPQSGDTKQRRDLRGDPMPSYDGSFETRAPVEML